MQFYDALRCLCLLGVRISRDILRKVTKSKNLALGTWICPYGVRIVSRVLKLTR